MINGRVPARFFIYSLLFIPATLLPIALALSRWIIVSKTFGASQTHFELLGFSLTAWLVLVAWIEFRKRPGTTAEKLTLLVPWVLIGLFALNYIVESSGESFDYIGYRKAAQDVLNGNNPYATQTYLYPPLFAQLLAGVFILVRSFLAIFSPNIADKVVWNFVFYFYHCFQFLLVLIAFWLCYRLARIFCTDRIRVVVLLTALFVFNNPLIRTLKYNQVNLLLLDFLLVVILFANQRPWVSGFFNSVACHLKLYPFIFFIPWTFKKRWAPILTTTIFFMLIVLIQAAMGGVELWSEFVRFFPTFPTSDYYRDNSVHSVIYNLIYFPILPFNVPNEQFLKIVKYAHLAASLLILLIFLLRWYKQRQTENEIVMVLEGLALMLLISPLVWEHHYVLLLPYVIWNLIRPSHQHQSRAFLGAFLIYAIPTFDLFPFSYHRIAGLILMLSSTPGWKWNKE